MSKKMLILLSVIVSGVLLCACSDADKKTDDVKTPVIQHQEIVPENYSGTAVTTDVGCMRNHNT